MEALSGEAPDWTLGWVRAPMLVPTTRLSVMANPASGRLVVQGWERQVPVTQVLVLG